MGDPMLTYTLLGDPRTKKNSQQIRRTATGRPFVAPSKAFAEYERSCLAKIKTPYRPVSAAVNVKCVYYMPTKRKVDLVNLLEASLDILVRAGVLADDCAAIVAAHDGSRVLLDRENPRVEIEITEMDDET